MGNLNFKLIYRFLGVTAILNGLFMWISLPFSLYYNEPSKWGILSAGIITIAIGLLLFLFNKPDNKNIQKKKDILLLPSDG